MESESGTVRARDRRRHTENHFRVAEPNLAEMISFFAGSKL